MMMTMKMRGARWNRLVFAAVIGAACFFVAIAIGTALSAGSAGAARAADRKMERASLIVTTQWVAEHLKDADLVLIAVGKKEEYERGHIPGSRFLEYSRISTARGSGLMLELPPVEQLVTVFEKLGVSDSSRVVVYASGDEVTLTTRVYLTLDYLGLRDRISFLDGGFAEWEREGRAVSKDEAKVAAGTLTAHARSDVVIPAEAVLRDLHHAGIRLIDAREPSCYTGAENCYFPRAGHIPGAGNIPIEALIDDSGKIKPLDQVRTIFQSAGVQPGDEVIAYCHIGQRATLVYLLARVLGHEARLYDGSFEEWSARKELPVEKSAGAATP